MKSEIYGDCLERFAFLRDELRQEMRSGRTLGQAVAVVARGETLVHLWCGHADADRKRAWDRDTLVCLFSASKPLAAACVLKLIESGRIELDAPLARYWPSFAQHGKERITVRHALAHLAGVPIAESAGERAVYDREALARALEAQPPLWPAGEQLCFHSFTYGVLCGELVRRTDGRTLPQFFREELASPFDLDLAFALTEDEQRRCADLELIEDNALFRMMNDPATVLGRSWRPMPWSELSTPQFRGCDFPSIGAHGGAVGLARFYGAMASGGALDGKQMLSALVVDEALREQRHAPDAFMQTPVRMGLGFMLHNAAFPFTGSARSFGQPGLGGVAGVGDAALGVGIGVASNRLSAGIANPFLDRLLRTVAAKL
jgi:CubicO group peptidase (beta-lactamase class C family)